MYKHLDDLGFKEGDTVRCVRSDFREYVKGKTYKVSRGALVELHLRELNGKYVGTGYSGDWELVEPDTDMTNNRVPFGLLTEEEKEVLKSWDGRFSFYSGYGPWGLIKEPTWIPHYVYRTVPKPKTIPVSDLKGTVEMKDGKPDWSTYFED